MISRRFFLKVSALAAMPVGATSAFAADPIYQTRRAKIRLKKIATGLDHPWAVAFLPDGTKLITERAGRIRRVRQNGGLSQPILGVPDVSAAGQGGLLDLVISPNFRANRQIFMSFAEPRNGGNGTAVARAVLSPDMRFLANVKVIWRQRPAYNGDKHFGSRIVFDRSGNLFVTTGDRSDLRDEAQDPTNTLGKIVHITPAGGVPANNPRKTGWLPALWSIGHRNLQGAALHPGTGALWTVEHGAKGGDELNQPQAGRNYGWPVISYGTDYDGSKIGEGTAKPGLEQPKKYWDPSIAPSGLAFYSGRRIAGWAGNLFLGALAGERLVRLRLTGNRVVGEEQMLQGLGRIRDVREGPDGYLYILTDAAAPGGTLYRIEPVPT
jgi:aldose sugar dehydrogenase